MTNTYYLPIARTSLSNYIKYAIILPTRFYPNRVIDLQSNIHDYILLSKKPFVNSTDCAIELVLTNSEVKRLKSIDQNSHIVFLDIPLPISRIKTINFINKDHMTIIISQINKGTGFIDNKYLKLHNTFDAINIDLSELNIDKYLYSDEIKSKIKFFNQILGGIAFVRYNLNNKYTKNYFSILSYFNNVIKKEYLNNSQEELNIHYNGVFDCSGKWEHFAALVYETITDENIVKYANDEKINISKDIAGNFEFTKIDKQSKTYIYSILNTYSTFSHTRKSIDDLISDFLIEKIPKEKQEGISLLIGINNGYSSLYNRYKEKTVKFMMDSLLDLYTVESVFQYAINDIKTMDKFQYLNNIIKKESIFNYDYDTYHILDETIVTNKKSVLSAIEDKVSEGWFPKNIFDKLKIFIEEIVKKKDDQNQELKDEIKKEQQSSKEIENKNTELLKQKDDEIAVIQKRIVDAEHYYKQQKSEIKNLNLQIDTLKVQKEAKNKPIS
ncbi:MAG: hypothetical protein U9N59_04285, partial [Campylobacterota bacterium]|nr:hypothetical protein [Campylobacterota bacterium]